MAIFNSYVKLPEGRWYVATIPKWVVYGIVLPTWIPTIQLGRGKS